MENLFNSEFSKIILGVIGHTIKANIDRQRHRKCNYSKSMKIYTQQNFVIDRL